jgi:lysozyme
MPGLDFAALKADLLRDEGRAKTRPDRPGRYFPYRDKVGKLTIYAGRNLDDEGISEAEGELLLANDIDEHLALLDKHLAWWRSLDDVRQRALANLAFNIGVGPSAEQPEGSLLAFHGTLKALQAGDYEVAAKHLEVTLWREQVGERAERVIAMLRTGTES